MKYAISFLKNNRLKKYLTLFALAILTTILVFAAKERQITGIVVDERNQPIAGVHVEVKNTMVATATDLDGTYSIIASELDTLIFSASGYDTRQIAVGEYTIINVSLTETLTRLSAKLYTRECYFKLEVPITDN